jgi:hypothetical protein
VQDVQNDKGRQLGPGQFDQHQPHGSRPKARCYT